jgi:hypothetical protein
MKIYNNIVDSAIFFFLISFRNFFLRFSCIFIFYIHLLTIWKTPFTSTFKLVFFFFFLLNLFVCLFVCLCYYLFYYIYFLVIYHVHFLIESEIRSYTYTSKYIDFICYFFIFH